MTVFERSPEGIANRAIFFGVDFVAYHDGNEGDSYSSDMFFWQKVVSINAPNCRIRLLAAGSKTNIIEMIETLNENSAEVLFMLDRDHDDINGKFIDKKNVIYTYGYSFENDICASETVNSYIYQNFPSEEISLEAKAIFAGIVEDNTSGLQKISCNDQISNTEERRIIANSGYGNIYIDKKIGVAPKVSLEYVEREILRNTSTASWETKIDDDWRRRLNGHLIFDFYYRIIMHIAQKYDRKFRVDKKSLCRSFIALAWKNDSQDFCSVRSYYDERFRDFNY